MEKKSSPQREVKGNVHSIETFGTVDGPGIRFVVFLQGCLLQCQYCHNPDTWDTKGGTAYTVNELLDEYEKYSSYLTDGGITVTGGEALIQMHFIIELFKEAKKRGIHTCIDTSGATFRKGLRSNVARMTELMEYTDLVMLDLKHIDDEEHKKLTSVSNKNILDFATWLSDIDKKVWIRHVVIPTLTLNDEYLYDLGRFIGTLHNVEKLELLPYHVMGVNKWETLGWKYPLDGIEPPTTQEFNHAQKMVVSGIRDERRSRFEVVQ